jgi:hypothetical protein
MFGIKLLLKESIINFKLIKLSIIIIIIIIKNS